MTFSELSPDHWRDLFRAADAQLRAGNLVVAATLYHALLDRTPDDPDLLHRLGVIAGQNGELDKSVDLIRQALVQRPDSWDFRQNLALTLERKGDRIGAAAEYGKVAKGLSIANQLGEARSAFEYALKLDDGNGAWYAGVGQIAGRQGRAAEAVIFLKQAARLSPDDTGIAADLGAGLLEHRQPEEALISLRRAVVLDPANAAAWSNMGIVTERTGSDDARYGDAMAFFARALIINPDLMTAHCNYGLALLRAGRFDEGWAEHDAGCEPLPSPPLPQWHGEPPEAINGSVLLLSEQGLGDTLQYCRYALAMAERGHTVEMLAQPALRGFLAQGLRHERLRILNDGDPVQAVAVAPLMKLPNRMRLGGNIPKPGAHITADPVLIAEWRQRLAPSPGERLVGLCWAGNPRHLLDKMRSATLADLAPLGKVAGVRFVSLQVGDAAAFQPAPEDLPLVRFKYDELVPLEKLAALMRALDLVISVDSMPLHLAGVLGVPTWGMIPTACDARWMIGRTDSLWYDSVRLFRQSTAGDWGAVVQAMASALALHFKA